MKKARSPKEPVKATNIFQCPNCEGNPEFDGVEPFKQHLVDVHKITEFKGTRTMTLHLDCADSYHSTYELKIGGLKFAQFCSNPRRKDDLMRYA